MGVGAKSNHCNPEIDNESIITHGIIPPGYFWCEYFTGDHVSIDYKRKLIWVPFNAILATQQDPKHLTKFGKWTRIEIPNIVIPEFLNIFLNALYAMSRGGWLSITTRFDGNQIAIEISDTGNGIAPEHLARIYDPFFTTKTAGQSIGLGLSITYGIVKEHKGSLVCESTIGKGTCFTIEFPKTTVDELRPIQAAN